MDDTEDTPGGETEVANTDEPDIGDGPSLSGWGDGSRYGPPESPTKGKNSKVLWKSAVKVRTVRFRVTEPEFQLWRETAQRENLQLSEWMRMRLNRREGLSIEADLLTKILGQQERLNELLVRWLSSE